MSAVAGSCPGPGWSPPERPRTRRYARRGQAKAAVADRAGRPIPSTKLGNLKDLKPNEPMDVAYPDADAPGVLLKIGKRVQGGAGPDGDIVGFTTICPHKGYPLAYNGRQPHPELLRPLLDLRLRGRRPGDLGPRDPEPPAIRAPRRRQRRHLRRGRGRADLRPPVERALREDRAMAYKRQIDRLPIIPADAKEHNVVCHYCIVGCGYKAYTWDIDKQGTTDPSGNKFERRPVEAAGRRDRGLVRARRCTTSSGRTAKTSTSSSSPTRTAS